MLSCYFDFSYLYHAGPCASNTPHIHPRGSEIAYMIEGEVTPSTSLLLSSKPSHQLHA